MNSSCFSSISEKLTILGPFFVQNRDQTGTKIGKLAFLRRKYPKRYKNVKFFNLIVHLSFIVLTFITCLKCKQNQKILTVYTKSLGVDDTHFINLER